MNLINRGATATASRSCAELVISKEVLIDTLTWLMRTPGDGGGGGFLSTHPATEDSIAALRRLG